MRKSYGPLLAAHLLFLAVFCATITPQLAAYQVLNGVPRPSGEVGGKLDWRSPCFVHTLVDITECRGNGGGLRHGALAWSPVLALGLVGLPLLWRRDRLLAMALALVFLGQTYANGAIFTWHLTGSFGFRRLIECTPVFVVGLALLAARVPRRWIAVAVAALFVSWNAGLALNWAVLQPELRRGLDWTQLWQWQLAVPQRLLTILGDLIFNRCRLFENQGC